MHDVGGLITGCSTTTAAGSTQQLAWASGPAEGDLALLPSGIIAGATDSADSMVVYNSRSLGNQIKWSLSRHYPYTVLYIRR